MISYCKGIYNLLFYVACVTFSGHTKTTVNAYLISITYLKLNIKRTYCKMKNKTQIRIDESTIKKQRRMNEKKKNSRESTNLHSETKKNIICYVREY